MEWKKTSVEIMNKQSMKHITLKQIYTSDKKINVCTNDRADIRFPRLHQYRQLFQSVLNTPFTFD